MAIQRINVTQLKYACLDPEWRNRWLAGKKPPAKSFPKSGTVPVSGSLFHKIVKQYTHWLTDPAQHHKASADEASLWDDLYTHFAEKHLTAMLESGKTESACHLSECLRNFCHRLSELQARTSRFRSWQDVFLTHEFSVKNVRIDVGNSFLFVSGQMDAVRTHPVYGVEVVDYKLSHGANLTHDLLQIAIYAKLLEIKKGLNCRGVLEYYEPALHDVTASEQQLKSIFQDVVIPVVYELVRQPVPTPVQKHIELPQPEKRKHPFDLSESIRQCLKSFRLNVEIIGSHEAPQAVRYKIKPAAGVKVASLASRAKDLQVALSLKYPPIIEPAQGYVIMDIPKETPDTVIWKDIIQKHEYTSHRSPVSFPVGLGIDNQVVIADFADPNMCHALVAGASGSGKSEFLKSVVASLMVKNTPELLKLTIIDPKILTFGALSGSPFLSHPIITDTPSAITRLQESVSETDNRYKQFQTEGIENLSQRMTSGRKEIPFHIIVIDEFADLILAGREEKKEFEKLVSRIAAKGRAAGIHLVLSTQRPDSKIVTGLIKANLPLKICLRVNSETNSRIILDQGGGQSLVGKGDLLCNRGKGIERAQSPYIGSLNTLY